jgi:hypothetical protein
MAADSVKGTLFTLKPIESILIYAAGFSSGVSQLHEEVSEANRKSSLAEVILPLLSKIFKPWYSINGVANAIFKFLCAAI